MFIVSSAISRAILKSVYQSGIPNSDTQTVKSVKNNSSKNRQLTFHTLVPQHVEPQEGCFELLRIQNRQNFPGLCPWTPLGRAYSTPSRLPSCTTVAGYGSPPKLLDTALISPIFQTFRILRSHQKLLNIKHYGYVFVKKLTKTDSNFCFPCSERVIFLISIYGLFLDN